MKEKAKEFKQIQILREKYYDAKTVKYYLPHMFKVDDDKRPDYVVDCFDFVEYAAFGQMIYYVHRIRMLK
jgi:hypothetical protein